MKLISPSALVVGAILNALAAFLLIPAVAGVIYDTENIAVFLSSAGISSLTGFLLMALGSRHRKANLQARQMFLITASAWLVVPCFGSLPFLLSFDGLSFTDAIFESISGLTTTGSTIFVGLDSVSPDILLWRSLLQWLGGMGIIGMAIAVLPFLSIGGMKLFRTESSDWSEKSLPRTQQLLKQILGTYTLLTVICGFAYFAFGMDACNAVNHALTTLSTGGYSTSDNSFAQFDSLPLYWVSIFFMICGATPFVLFIRFMRHQDWKIFQDEQWKGMLSIIAIITGLLSVTIYFNQDLPVMQAITHAAFSTVSIVTTTGYASSDYMAWGNFAIAIFFFATFLGGCSGSTSGGIKTFRVQLCFTMIKEQTAKAVHPNAVMSRRYSGSKVSDEIVSSLVGFLFIMSLSTTVITLMLTATGLDLTTSLTSAATALMNVGPGLGDVVGPAGNFSSLPTLAKWVLCMGMIMGRLEFLTIIVLFSPSFWRR